jgi:periplasmic protein TonB
MSNVSIFEKKWIDLVFEDRNQEYGAYKLRQENPKTAILALFSALFFIAAVSVIVILLSSFTSKPIEKPLPPPDIVIKVSASHFPKKEEPKKEIVPIKKEKTKDRIEKKDLINPIIVKDNPDAIATNKESKNNTPKNPDTEPGTGTNPTPPSGQPSTGPIKIPTDSGNGLAITTELDNLPEFPGGIKKFYEYVGNNFEKPELESGTSIKVLMYFVIEKDGSMTDIKVLRNPGYGMDKEAIRVLKSLKTKWKPGIKDGQKMRTQYTLPITVQMN